MAHRIVHSALIVIVALCVLPVRALTRVELIAELGGKQVCISGSGSTCSGGVLSTTRVQQSYPLSTFAVYLPGTSTLASIYTNSTGTSKPNPSTTDANAFAFFYIAPGAYTVTFSGGGIPTPFSRTVTIPSASGLTLSVLDYGAVCNGVADDTVAIQTAISILGPHTVTFPSGTCLVTDTLAIAQNRVNVLGQGQQNTVIKFQPASGGKPVFHLYSGSSAATIGQNKIDGFGFTSTNTTLQKIAVRVTDGEEIELSNLAIAGGGNWTGNTSIGVEIRGRQMINLHDCTLVGADEPIHIMQNPSFNGLDCDHCHFWNLYLGAGLSTKYNVEVDSNAVLTNFTVDGYEAWVLGKGGLHWANAAASASSSVSISNVRHEQTQDATGYIIDIGNTANINSLVLHNIYGGAGMNGFKVRQTNQLTISNCFYVGTATALDINATVFETAWVNSFSGLTGATASLVSQDLLFALATSNILTASPIHTTAFYKSTSNSSNSVTLNGGKFWTASGTLASSGQFNILNQSFTGNEKAFIVIVAARNNLTNAAEGGTVIVSGGASGQAALAGGTANFGVGNVGGKLTILWQNVSTITLLNQLGGGATIDYTITVMWN